MSRGGPVVALDFSDLIDFGRRFPAVAIDRIEEVMREAHRLMHARVLELATQLSPVGTTTRAGHQHLRPSWRSVPTNPESAIESLRPTRVVTGATHARVIDTGRRMARAYKRAGKDGRKHPVQARMVGSTQAPLGIRGPVMLTIGAEQESILRRAVETVMGAD